MFMCSQANLPTIFPCRAIACTKQGMIQRDRPVPLLNTLTASAAMSGRPLRCKDAYAHSSFNAEVGDGCRKPHYKCVMKVCPFNALLAYANSTKRWAVGGSP